MNEPRATNWCHECQRLAGQLKQAEAERDAALARMGVVVYEAERYLDTVQPRGEHGFIARKNLKDALASTPEIVAVVKVIGFASFGDGDPVLNVELPPGYRVGASDRAIIVRRGEG